MSNANQQPNRHDTAVATSKWNYTGHVALIFDPFPGEHQRSFLCRHMQHSQGSSIFKVEATALEGQVLVVRYDAHASHPEAALVDGVGGVYAAVQELNNDRAVKFNADYVGATLRPEPSSLPLPPGYNVTQAGQELYGQFDEMHRQLAAARDIIGLVSQYM